MKKIFTLSSFSGKLDVSENMVIYLTIPECSDYTYNISNPKKKFITLIACENTFINYNTNMTIADSDIKLTYGDFTWYTR